VDPGLF
jgi:hypothetical protein